MLSADEQRIWDEIERTYRAEADEVARRYVDPDVARTGSAGHVGEVPPTVVAGIAVVVIGVWATLVLLAVGAFIAAAVVGLATALAWRYWPLLRESDRQSSRVARQRVARAGRHEPARGPVFDEPDSRPTSSRQSTQ